jgi:glycosyltransferase involved in cell wall biosynthesis
MTGSRHSDVTVVVTCFDYGRFLRDAVDSALGQEGGAPRVVVVDDGSKDPDTLRALERLPPEVLVHRQENRGPAAARNTGAALTDTPYLLMLDADDLLRPAALSSLRAALEPEPRLGFAYGYAEFFGEWSGRLAFPAYDPFRLLYRSIVAATSLLRREAFADAGGFDAGLEGYEDWDLYLSALARGWRGIRVPEVVLSYRRHGGSRLSADRVGYRGRYRAIRTKHRGLYARSDELARESDLGAAGRLVYRTFWAWRPLPARLEKALYGRLFRSRS